MPPLERLFVHGTHNCALWKCAASGVQSRTNGLLPTPTDLAVRTLLKGQRIGGQHVTQPYAFERCKLIGTGGIMASTKGHQHQLTCVNGRVPCVVGFREQAVPDDPCEDFGRTFMTPRRLCGTHLNEKAGHVKGWAVVRDFKRHVKPLDLVVSVRALEKHFPPGC